MWANHPAEPAGSGRDFSAVDHLQIMNWVRSRSGTKAAIVSTFADLVKGLFMLEIEAPRGWVLMKGP